MGATTITVDKAPLTVSGTDDVVLAALIASPELSREIRIRAACEGVRLRGQ